MSVWSFGHQRASGLRSGVRNEATEERRAKLDGVNAGLADAFKRTPLSAGGVAKDCNHFADPSVARLLGAEESRIEVDRVGDHVGSPQARRRGVERIEAPSREIA